MATINFSVKGLPQTKGSTRAFIPRGWRRPIITNDNPKNKGWAQAVRVMAMGHSPVGGPWPGPVELLCRFWLKKPKSMSKKRRFWHTRKPDLDKLTRSIKDALTGVIYNDDSQIVGLHCFKEYGDEPGVDIELVNILELSAQADLWGGK